MVERIEAISSITCRVVSAATHEFRRNSQQQQLCFYLEPIKIYNFPPASEPRAACRRFMPDCDCWHFEKYFYCPSFFYSAAAGAGEAAGLYVASFSGL